MMLRPGNAGSNAAVDHIAVIREALRQLPFTATGGRIGRKVLIRTDSAGATHEVVDWLTARHLSYSLGFTLTDDTVAAIAKIPDHVWTPASDTDGDIRDGAWVLDATGCSTCPAGPGGCGSSSEPNAPTPARNCGSPTCTATGSPRSPPTPSAVNLPTWTTLAPGPLRRPHPHRQRHRPAQPPAARLRAKPIRLAIVTLAVELTAWTGDPRLDRARRPATGTQTTTARAVRHTQPDRPPRTQHLPDQHQPGSSQHHTPEKWNLAAHLSRQLGPATYPKPATKPTRQPLEPPKTSQPPHERSGLANC